MNYPPNAPPPGGYGGPPPGGYGPPPGGPGGPPGGYGPPPPGGFGPPPGMPGMGPGMGAPMAPYGVDPITGLPFSDKSKMVAGLLQIFLGTFGIGRFYTGHTGIAIAQLLVGWITCGIWPLVDGILMLMGKVTDAQGRPLRD
ncbi:TM2 domain-containing protein [Labilithrix luteola]|nr:TM2 domain-containing protein [Labilithrix luteola]